MPRAPSKRAAAGAAAASERQPKRAKSSGTASSAAAAAAAAVPASAPAPAPKSKRWAAVSVSRNIDDDFKLAVQDPERANAYTCVCRPSYIVGDDRFVDSEDEDDEDESDEEGKECDGGETCVCQKPASEHPEHTWILTYAGFRKWMASIDMAGLRNPDNFNLITFNDHTPYGILEVNQNLILDWVEAGTWQEQWAVCEGLVFFGLREGIEFYMIDDGAQADVFAQLIGRLFLTMLSRLEAKGLLSDGSEVKNLGLVMALYIKLADSIRKGCLLEKETAEYNSRPDRFKWIPSRFENYINAFALKFGITLQGLDDIDELTADLDTDVLLPANEASWDWDRSFKSYCKRYATAPPVGGAKAMIGGDQLDITAWSSAERKRFHLYKKDPLTKKDIDAMKEGLVMHMM